MTVDLLQVKSPSRESELIINQCRRASDMIGRILEFSRGAPHRPADIDLRGVVSESARMIASTLPGDVRLDVCLTETPAWSHADETQIQQVVQNLMVNARDAMRGTGGELRVSLEPLAGGREPPEAIEPAENRSASSETESIIGDDGKPVILAVDDDQSVLRVVELGLGQLGYRVISAGSGRQALRQFNAQASDIDLVLSDLRMPGIDGVELLHRFRRVDPQVAMVMMSGDIGGEVDGLDPSHIVGWLRKPFTINELAHAVEQGLARETS